MKNCRNCGLPEALPTARLDARNICQYCRRYRGGQESEAIRARLRLRFEVLLEENKGRAPFDVLMAYSGGKDSSYTLWLLRTHYHARVLAYTMDHGFVASKAWENARRVCASLDVAHWRVAPEPGVLRAAFNIAREFDLFPPKSLERASNICTVCMAFVKFIGLRAAIDAGLPFIAYGWSPGQAPVQSSVWRLTPDMLRESHEALFRPLCEHIDGRRLRPYFLEERHWAAEDRIPCQINPLAFRETPEEEIIETISGLGWEQPEGLDANSTNCLLNSYAIHEHQKRFGFHPYAFELATLVRKGLMDRETALRRLAAPPSPSLVRDVSDWLGEGLSWG